jgi:hypothetical protein
LVSPRASTRGGAASDTPAALPEPGPDQGTALAPAL